MRIVLYLSAIVLLAVCATWAYRVNYATQEKINEVAALRREIATEREALAVLRAEWAYLNRPDRLRALVAANAEALGLIELTPDHFGEVSEVALPPPPAPAPEDEGAPVAQTSDGVAPMAAEGGAESAPETAARVASTEPAAAGMGATPAPGRGRWRAAAQPAPKAPVKKTAVRRTEVPMGPLVGELVARARAAEGMTP